MEHTPGDWKFRKIEKPGYTQYQFYTSEKDLNDDNDDLIYEDDVFIKICDYANGITPEEAEANAYLVRAAPKLLEALKSLVEMKEISRKNPELAKQMLGASGYS